MCICGSYRMWAVLATVHSDFLNIFTSVKMRSKNVQKIIRCAIFLGCMAAIFLSITAILFCKFPARFFFSCVFCFLLSFFVCSYAESIRQSFPAHFLLLFLVSPCCLSAAEICTTVSPRSTTTITGRLDTAMRLLYYHWTIQDTAGRSYYWILFEQILLLDTAIQLDFATRYYFQILLLNPTTLLLDTSVVDTTNGHYNQTVQLDSTLRYYHETLIILLLESTVRYYCQILLLGIAIRDTTCRYCYWMISDADINATVEYFCQTPPLDTTNRYCL